MKDVYSMDLLLKNPSYFFETYFDFNLAEWLPIYLLLLLSGMIWIHINKPDCSRCIIVLLHASYGAFVLGITILNHSRVGTQNILINPWPILKQLLSQNRVHIIRATLSNMMLFVPIGVFSAIKAKTNNYMRAIIVGFLFSFFIELMQYFCHRGTFEILDIICNVFGAWLGAMFMQIILRIWRMMICLYLKKKP